MPAEAAGTIRPNVQTERVTREASPATNDRSSRRSALEDEVFRGVEPLQRHAPPRESSVIQAKSETVEAGIITRLVERAVDQKGPLTGSE